MKLIIKTFALVTLLAAPFFAQAEETFNEWCLKDKLLCSSLINTCESSSQINCDELTKRVRAGEGFDLDETAKK